MLKLFARFPSSAPRTFSWGGSRGVIDHVKGRMGVMQCLEIQMLFSDSWIKNRSVDFDWKTQAAGPKLLNVPS